MGFQENFYSKVLGDLWELKDSPDSIVNEPSGGYQAIASPDTIIHKQKHWFLAKKGLSKEILIRLKNETGFSWEELASYLQVSLRTIQRKPTSFVFASSESERMLGIADVFSKGYDVFEDPKQFKGWLNSPNEIFEGQRPKDLLDSYYGIDLIIKALGRIEHGIFV